MSGPAIAAHAAQNTQAAGLIATKFIKPSHTTGQAAFDALLQKLATQDSQPQTGDDVKSGAEDTAKSDAAKDESGQERSRNDLQVAPDADPAAAIAALVAPQSTTDASTAAIAALLASPAQVDSNAATVGWTSQPTATGVNAQAFGAKSSTSAAQAWAARLQAQSHIGDSGEGGGVVMPSDSTTHIAATATPTTAPAVVDVHVQSARTFLGLDNSAQIVSLNADNNAPTIVDPTSGAKATITAETDTKQNALSAAVSGAAARVTPSSAANPIPGGIPAAELNAFSATAVLDASASPAMPNAAISVPAAASTRQNATPASNGQEQLGEASTQSVMGGAINSDSGSAVRVRSKADSALYDSATGPKVAPTISGVASAGSSSGQQTTGGSTQRNTSNGARGAGASANNTARADGAIVSGASNPVGASAAAGVAAVTAAAVGPLTVDQLPDLIASQATTLTGSAQTPASSGVTAANLNPVKELNVQLNPADLGSLTVKMRLANGNLAVVIEASKDSTAKMIAGERDAIAERLASADQPLASVTVQASGSVPNQGDNSNGSSATPQQGDAQSGAANGFDGSDGQGRSSGGGNRSQAGQANSTDDQTSGRSLTGDLFV